MIKCCPARKTYSANEKIMWCNSVSLIEHTHIFVANCKLLDILRLISTCENIANALLSTSNNVDGMGDNKYSEYRSSPMH